MGILIDSDVWIDLERKKAGLADRVKGRENEEVYISVISASELLHGIHRAGQAAVRVRRQAFVEALLAAFPILEIDLPTARAHAQVWSSLLARGERIGIHDAWLAAACLAHGLTLVTRNAREFERIPGLSLEIWP